MRKIFKRDKQTYFAETINKVYIKYLCRLVFIGFTSNIYKLYGFSKRSFRLVYDLLRCQISEFELKFMKLFSPFFNECSLGSNVGLIIHYIHRTHRVVYKFIYMLLTKMELDR